MENTCTPNIKSSYTYEDLLASGRGELFGKEGPQLPAPTMLMMDRIVKMTEDGGACGKGFIQIYRFSVVTLLVTPLCLVA